MDETLAERVRALADAWGDEDDQIAHVGSCQNYACGDCVVAACSADLRALLDAPAPTAREDA